MKALWDEVAQDFSKFPWFWCFALNQTSLVVILLLNHFVKFHRLLLRQFVEQYRKGLKVKLISAFSSTLSGLCRAVFSCRWEVASILLCQTVAVTEPSQLSQRLPEASCLSLAQYSLHELYFPRSWHHCSEYFRFTTPSPQEKYSWSKSSIADFSLPESPANWLLALQPSSAPSPELADSHPDCFISIFIVDYSHFIYLQFTMVLNKFDVYFPRTYFSAF